jgi:hypothetical protein
MIVNHTHKFIFVHVPKAAGTSLTLLLSKLTAYRDQEIGGTAFGESIQDHYSKNFGLRKHSSAVEISNVVSPIEWNTYFKFAFVRHPIKRLISAYQFLSKWEGLPEEAKRRLAPVNGVDTFLESRLWRKWDGPDNIFCPQVRWLAAEGGMGKVMVDYVGKLETMEADLAKISERICVELSFDQLPKMNRTEYDKPVEISDALASDLRSHYARDFELFQYD